VLAGDLQTDLDDGVPLAEATLCVVDLETTGGSPVEDRITEIGAVKVRGGERIGVFQTLVHPGVPIPPFVAHLTGIDDLTVARAPSIREVVPSFAEFARGCVFVAHNARFDFAFLNAALERLDFEPLPPPPVCTARLARRIVWPDIPNVRLATLARYFRTAARPRHRALPDAETCAEVLHCLLELGGRLGIRTVGDLRAALTARGRPNYGKIRLADGLPRAPGVYLFRNREGAVLYVGKSRDLRTRVRSYFHGDPRKQIGQLVEQTASVEGVVCPSEVEALAVEARLIRTHEPVHNRRGKTWRRYAYLKVDRGEAYPRIKLVREPRGDGCYLGPFPSSRHARLAKEALEDAFPIRRCTRPMRAATRFPPCALADIGRCVAPCDGRISLERYDELVRSLLSSLTSPGGLLETLERRMTDLAAAERFEEAALARERLRALAEGLRRARTDSWLTSGQLVLRDRDGVVVSLAGGVPMGAGASPVPMPVPRDRADELAAVRAWIARSRPVLQRAGCPPCEPVDGGALLHRLLRRLRDAREPRRADPARDG